jgi:hypothetical protein
VVSQWRKRFFKDRLAGLEEMIRPGRLRVFPLKLTAETMALACELQANLGLPLL